MARGLAQSTALHRIAERLHAAACARCPGAAALPPLLLMTDPVHTPDAVAAAERLPAGSGVVYRAFGSQEALQVGRRLAEVARRRRLVLLIGADWRLARRIGAEGVHLPERLAHRAPSVRAAWPRATITMAAHSRAALARAARFGADAAVLSVVFESASASAGSPIGSIRFGAMARAAGLPVYALGGVNEETAPRLLNSGAVGIAAVSALVCRRPAPC